MRVIKWISLILAAFIVSSCSNAVKPARVETNDLKYQYEAQKITFIAQQGTPPSSFYYGLNQGFKPINEPTFLHLAGYEKEAGESSANLFWKDVITWAGALCFLGGCAYEVGGVVNAAGSSGKSDFLTPILVGGGMQLGGVFVLYFGLLKPPNTQPLGRTEQLVNAYNDRLMDQISQSNQ